MPQPFDIQPIYQLLSLLLGGTTAVGFYTAWKSRKANVQITETTALQELRKAYREFVVDNNERLQQLKNEHRLEVEELKKEMQSLREEIEAQKNQCKHCKTKAA